jgi:hypothetical protein
MRVLPWTLQPTPGPPPRDGLRLRHDLLGPPPRLAARRQKGPITVKVLLATVQTKDEDGWGSGGSGQ